MTELSLIVAECLGYGWNAQVVERHVMEWVQANYKRRFYRRCWRPETTKALYELRSRPLTTPDFGRLVQSQSARKTLSELAESGLAHICGTKNGTRLYRITQKGIDFLDGKMPAPESWWPPNAPSDCEPGELKYIHEIKSKHPLNNPAAHATV